MSEDNHLIVEPRKFKHRQSFRLESGESLNGFELIYETYGELNKEKSNAILICHALSGNHHAAGVYSKEDKKPGWWDEQLGDRCRYQHERLLSLAIFSGESAAVI